MIRGRCPSLIPPPPKTSMSLGSRSYASTWMHHEYEFIFLFLTGVRIFPAFANMVTWSKFPKNVVRRICVRCTCQSKHLPPRVPVTIPARAEQKNKAQHCVRCQLWWLINEKGINVDHVWNTTRQELLLVQNRSRWPARTRQSCS